MNEKCKMEIKNEMGPKVLETSEKQWVQKDSIQCTEKCNMTELVPKVVLPRQNEWAYPDVDPCASAGYPIFDSISDLNDFVSFFEEKNADYIQQLIDNSSVKTKAMIATAPIFVGGL